MSTSGRVLLVALMCACRWELIYIYIKASSRYIPELGQTGKKDIDRRQTEDRQNREAQGDKAQDNAAGVEDEQVEEETAWQPKKNKSNNKGRSKAKERRRGRK